MKRQDEKNAGQEEEFTTRQLLILQLWAEHSKIRNIADELGLSEHTVQTHLKRMRRKLGVHRTFDVYKYAKERQLL